jgi:hypothetical protein
MTYSVKLYGELSENKDLFPEQLAQVLNLEVNAAAALLDNVPVVVLAHTSKTQAERLAQDLASIKALYLVESEGQDGEPEEPITKLIPISHDEQPQKPEVGEDQGRNSWRFVLFAGGAGIALIVVLFLLLSVRNSMRPEYRPAPTATESDTSKAQERPGSEQGSAPEAELQSRIESLERRNDEIKSLIELKRQDIDRQMSGSFKDFELLRRSRVELGELNSELKSNLDNIKALQVKIRQSAPRPPIKF